MKAISFALALSLLGIVPGVLAAQQPPAPEHRSPSFAVEALGTSLGALAGHSAVWSLNALPHVGPAPIPTDLASVAGASLGAIWVTRGSLTPATLRSDWRAVVGAVAGAAVGAYVGHRAVDLVRPPYLPSVIPISLSQGALAALGSRLLR